MRTARQISKQAKAKKIDVAIIGMPKENPTFEIAKALGAITITPEPVTPTILIAPNARIAEKLSQPKVVEPIKEVSEIIIDGRYKITNSNGYSLEQLNTPLPRQDYELIEKGLKIPVNYGMGVEVEYENQRYIFKRGGSTWRGTPTVTLEITTWRGISAGAMHYYGHFNVRLPEMTEVDSDGWTCSNYIPMYDNDRIELTQELEQWEIDKYPENYEYNRAGQRHTGFYTEKQLKDYAEVVFAQIFEKGWKYRIEER
jgi:hypothetical protein